MYRKNIAYLLLATASLLLVGACATQKRKGELSGTKKAYHNLTSRFNWYFNANEIVEGHKRDLRKNRQENYAKLLPIFEYEASETGGATPGAATPAGRAADTGAPTRGGRGDLGASRNGSRNTGLNTRDQRGGARGSNTFGGPAAPGGAAPAGGGVSGNLDDAIEKVSVMIKKHQGSDWEDDGYLLLGQARYLKSEFEAAEEAFAYLTVKYSIENLEEEPKKKSRKKRRKKTSKKKKGPKKERRLTRAMKKEREEQAAKEAAEAKAQAEKEAAEAAKSPISASGDEEPKKYFLKRTPAYWEGMLWLARTQIKQRKYDDAASTLANLKSDGETPKRYYDDVAEMNAYYFLAREDYTNAIPALEQALEQSDSRRKKARYAFILAQLMQQEGGDQGRIYAYYKQAAKYAPSYEMVFSSKLNMAQSEYLSGTATAEDAASNLRKMLKDSKNKEYKGQIYYALGNLAIKNNDPDGAISYYRQALAAGGKQQSQQAEAYLSLARLFFEREMYVEAKNYYDSTLTTLPDTDERYADITRYRDNLTDIARNIQIITLQDSLLAIADMSPEEQTQLATRLRAAQDQGDRTDGPEGPKEEIGVINRGNSNFFAYNSRNLRRGIREFERTWGDRPLEDNWRRKNRQSEGGIRESGEDIADVVELTEAEVAEVLKDVPRTEASVRASNKLIENSLFELGTLYRDRLKNNEKATSTLLELFRRYPKPDRELDGYYYLYSMYDEANNATKRSYYYDQIVNRFPSSNYAKVLQNPDLAASQDNAYTALSKYYDDTFSSFSDGNFDDVITRIDGSDQQFGLNNEMKPKFALLRAMTVGAQSGKDAYIKALQDMVAKYPDTPEQLKAQDMLRYLTGKATTAPATTPTAANSNPAAAAQYKYEANRAHYMLILPASQVEMKDVKVNIETYTATNFPDRRLRLTSVFLGTQSDTPVLILRRFRNAEEAKAFYTTVVGDLDNFFGMPVSAQVYVVSQSNYRTILKNKALDGYDAFFQENYLK